MPDKKMSPEEIFEQLKEILSAYSPALVIRVDNETDFEVAGTREVLQGRKMVQGHYFASLVVKPKDVRLYYFPIYTHPEAFEDISAELRKCLKGKSCFHIKKLPSELKQQIQHMVEKGVHVYQEVELI